MLFFGAFFANAQATGSLLLSPTTGVYQENGVFSVRVTVNTSGQAINAAEGVLSFNNSELSVISVSEAGSIFNLWTTEPEFSNAAGTVTFGGGSPKGYTGSAGTVFTVTFRALKESTAKVTFQSGVMLAADGRGTNIIGSLKGGTYTITPAATVPPPEIVVPDNTPGTPNVKSNTHPDPEKWYTSKDVEFSWDVPSDVTNVRLTADERSSTIPAVFYDTPIESKTLEDFDEGAWYLHVQFRNEHGWGRIAHFPFKIDATKPESFVISQVDEVDPENPGIGFFFDAVDEVSGVEDYEIQIDGGEILQWKDDGSHIYRPGTLTPGEHTMIVRALDGAGNFLVDTITFTVAAVNAPVFTDYPEILNSGGILVLRGVSLPDSLVSIHIERKGDDEEIFDVEANENGDFTFILEDNPRDGVYSIFAIATDKNGALSDSSETITIAVRPSGFIKLGSLAISYLSILIPLIALILFAIFFMLFGVKKVREYKQRVRKEVTEAEAVLHESFTKLHFDVQKHVKKLEAARRKRALTKEEEKMVNELNTSLNEAEKVVSKEIRDIKRVR